MKDDSVTESFHGAGMEKATMKWAKEDKEL